MNIYVIYHYRHVFDEKFIGNTIKLNKYDLTRLKDTGRLHVRNIIVNRQFCRQKFRFYLQYVIVIYENYTTHTAPLVKNIFYQTYEKEKFEKFN